MHLKNSVLQKQLISILRLFLKDDEACLGTETYYIIKLFLFGEQSQNQKLNLKTKSKSNKGLKFIILVL